jgi:hypothetical protein
MRSPLFLLGPSVLAVLAGCTSSVLPSSDGAGTDADVSTTATGVVVVEGAMGNEGTRTEAVARFVRARGGSVDDDALRIVGATVDFPALGACSALSALATARAASAPNSVSRSLALLDVGGVTLFAGEGVASLQARQLPDVADLVSGVVYSARSEALPSKSAYLLRIDGAAEADVAPFVVSATSPGEPADVRLGGDDGRSGAITLAPGAAVDLTWEPGAVEDAVYVDIAATAASATARCLFDDGGHATLSSSAFGALEDGTVAVHRRHRESFRAHGVDPGEVRFDFARVVSFVRR